MRKISETERIELIGWYIDPIYWMRSEMYAWYTTRNILWIGKETETPVRARNGFSYNIYYIHACICIYIYVYMYNRAFHRKWEILRVLALERWTFIAAWRNPAAISRKRIGRYYHRWAKLRSVETMSLSFYLTSILFYYRELSERYCVVFLAR